MKDILSMLVWPEYDAGRELLTLDCRRRKRREEEEEEKGGLSERGWDKEGDGSWRSWEEEEKRRSPPSAAPFQPGRELLTICGGREGPVVLNRGVGRLTQCRDRPHWSCAQAHTAHTPHTSWVEAAIATTTVASAASSLACQWFRGFVTWWRELERVGEGRKFGVTWIFCRWGGAQALPVGDKERGRGLKQRFVLHCSLSPRTEKSFGEHNEEELQKNAKLSRLRLEPLAAFLSPPAPECPTYFSSCPKVNKQFWSSCDWIQAGSSSQEIEERNPVL